MGREIARLRCLRGIDTLSAVGLCAEIGDWKRFPRPAHLMSYLGLVPSEDSTGQTRRQGSITKTGSGHGRRLLVEAAWHYRRARRTRRPASPRRPGATSRCPRTTPRTLLSALAATTAASTTLTHAARQRSRVHFTPRMPRRLTSRGFLHDPG
ncbi:MAG: transposase [Solirubrobacteraceae bacterium]